MTNDEFRKFARKLDQLWPGKITGEQLIEWKTAMVKYELDLTLEWLGRYFRGDKNPTHGAQPSIVAVLAIAREEFRAPDEPDKTKFQMLRAKWATECPERAQQFRNMTDERAEEICLDRKFRADLMAYGSDSNMTRESFNVWQQAVRKSNGTLCNYGEYDPTFWNEQRQDCVRSREEQQAVRDFWKKRKSRRSVLESGGSDVQHKDSDSGGSG